MGIILKLTNNLILHNPGPKMQVTENSKAKVLKSHRRAPKERPKALKLYVQRGRTMGLKQDMRE